MKPFYLLVFLVTLHIHAQQVISVCGTTEKNLELMERSSKSMYSFEQMKNQIVNAQKQELIEGVYKIPLVVHIMHIGEDVGEGSNLSNQQVFDGVQYLNNYWRKIQGTNGDGDGVDMEIEFELASFDPDGAPTNGIVRYDMSGVQSYIDNGVGVGGLDDYNSDESINSLKEYSYWNGNLYYNVWLVYKINEKNCYDGGGIAGYAYYANAHGYPADGTVILSCKVLDETSFTWAHEMGHALNLLHTFDGDTSIVDGELVYQCGDDGITDTPSHIRASAIPSLYGGGDCENTDENDCDPNFNVQISPTKTGNGTHQDHLKNIMNYSNCGNEFTSGQSAVTKDALINFRTSYINSSAIGGCNEFNLVISNITDSTFSIDWPIYTENTSYVLQIYLGEEATANLLYNENHDSSNMPYYFSGAIPNQEYFIKVTATCNNGITTTASKYVLTSCDEFELIIEDVTTSTFIIGWPINENTSYVMEIYYSEEDPTNLLYSEIHDSSNTPFNFTNAMPNQDYYVKVTATCSNGSTSSAVENVYTPCEIIETQWFDDFSDETYGCWEVYNAGDSNTWTLETIFEDGSAISGMYHIIYSETDSHDDLLMSPPVKIIDGINDGITFDALNGSLTSAESVIIVVFFVNSPLGNILDENVTPSYDSWQNYIYDLSAFEEETIRIGFHSTTFNKSIFYLDNVGFTNYNALDSDMAQLIKINLGPNPVRDELSIQSAEAFKNLKLFNISGQLLLEQTISNKSFGVNMSHYKASIYFLELTTDSNQKIIKKIIKK